MASLPAAFSGRNAAVAPQAVRSRAMRVQASGVQAAQAVGVKEVGAFTVRGTVRKVNEDRYDTKVLGDAAAAPGAPVAWAGVYDGHGGSATAEWLKDKLWPGFVQAKWASQRPQAAITEAFLTADKELLSARQGFMGMGERGVGGAKCGATAATALLYRGKGGETRLLAANCGDARTVLVRGGRPVELYEEHVPDKESERVRIERNNPNPKMPMVRYMGGTWRVGGLLALSRAFGDAYLKGSLQFEGVNAGGDNYSSGFGVIAEPFTVDMELTDEDSFLVVASDGLFAEEARGGGGGLDNDAVAELCSAAAEAGTPCGALAESLALAAQRVGSTDDVTVVVLRLQ